MGNRYPVKTWCHDASMLRLWYRKPWFELDAFYCSDDGRSVAIDGGHIADLGLDAVLVILDDAQYVDPQISNPEITGNLDGVLDRRANFMDRYGSAQGRQ